MVARWAGASVVIIASGPSLTVEDCDLVRQWREAVGGRCVVINTSYQRAPWADVLYACDGHWWARNVTDVRKVFHGELWTQDEATAKSYGLNYIKSERKDGLSRTPGVIHQGSNSLFQAMNLIQQWGATRNILLGADMSNDGKHTHWHKPHPNQVQSPYADWIRNFQRLAPDLKAAGVEVVNASRRTALKVWPQVSLEYALAVPVSLTATEGSHA